MRFYKEVPFYKKKKFIVPALLLLFLIAIRAALPVIIESQTNKKLSEFSPDIYGQVEDIDLSLIRGSITAEGLNLNLKENNETFLKIKDVETSLEWTAFLKGNFNLDIMINQAEVVYSKQLQEALKKYQDEMKEKAKVAKKKELPINIEQVDIKDSSVTLKDVPGLNDVKGLKVSDIQSHLANLTTSKSAPLTSFNFSSSLNKSPLNASGKVNLKEKPIEWDLNAELKSFNLPSINDFLRKKVPLTFTKGSLDFFTEVKSEGGKIEGYLKPFFDNLDIVKNKEEFKGAKHWTIEVLTAISNLLLRATDQKTMATKIPFTYEESLNIDKSKAIGKAIEHGYDEKLTPGIENTINLE